jgi:ribosome-binding factor A
MADFRNERISNLFKEQIGALIVSGKIKDPRVEPFLSITRVEIGHDLQAADVYVSSFKTEGGIATGVKGLQRAAPFIQRELAKTVKTRLTPKLRFHTDTAFRDSFDLIHKIESLAAKGVDDA